MRDEMVWAYSRGFSLIPLKPNDKRPAIQWGDYIHRNPTAGEYKLWKEAGLFQTGYGIVTGNNSGISVLDVDFKNGGMESLAEHDINVLDIVTWLVDTPNGRHYYFNYDRRAKQGADVFGAGVDIRNDGGFVVGPGSTVEGREYSWAFEFSPEEVALADCPRWMLQAPGNRVDKILTDFGEPIHNGERNNKLTSLAGTLFKSMHIKGFPMHISQSTVDAALRHINTTWCDSPLDGDEISAIVQSVRRYHERNENV